MTAAEIRAVQEARAKSPSAILGPLPELDGPSDVVDRAELIRHALLWRAYVWLWSWEASFWRARMGPVWVRRRARWKACREVFRRLLTRTSASWWIEREGWDGKRLLEEGVA